MRALVLVVLLAAIEDGDQPKIKRVIADMRTMAAAVEAYAGERGAYPRAANMTELRAALDPQYVQGLHVTDPWTNEYRYLITDDGKHYRIVCAGADGKFERAWEKMKAEPPKQQLSIDAASDLVYQDNGFRVVPEGFEKAFTVHEQRRVVPFQ